MDDYNLRTVAAASVAISACFSVASCARSFDASAWQQCHLNFERHQQRCFAELLRCKGGLACFERPRCVEAEYFECEYASEVPDRAECELDCFGIVEGCVRRLAPPFVDCQTPCTDDACFDACAAAFSPEIADCEARSASCQKICANIEQ